MKTRAERGPRVAVAAASPFARTPRTANEPQNGLSRLNGHLYGPRDNLSTSDRMTRSGLRARLAIPAVSPDLAPPAAESRRSAAVQPLFSSEARSSSFTTEPSTAVPSRQGRTRSATALITPRPVVARYPAPPWGTFSAKLGQQAPHAGFDVLFRVIPTSR
jgi:hypothetical protein